jgi:hypothetical protein
LVGNILWRFYITDESKSAGLKRVRQNAYIVQLQFILIHECRTSPASRVFLHGLHIITLHLVHANLRLGLIHECRTSPASRVSLHGSYIITLHLVHANLRLGSISRSCYTMADFLSERIYSSRDHSAGATDGNKRKQQPQQPRQLLSCTKCRERKVKVGTYKSFPSKTETARCRPGTDALASKMWYCGLTHHLVRPHKAMLSMLCPWLSSRLSLHSRRRKLRPDPTKL